MLHWYLFPNDPAMFDFVHFRRRLIKSIVCVCISFVQAHVICSIIHRKLFGQTKWLSIYFWHDCADTESSSKVMNDPQEIHVFF